MNFHDIESKWQKRWDEGRAFEAANASAKPKYYALSMFPYPSGVGLHIGHIASYTPTDIVSRAKRAQGFNVLQPMGYDAFGLPAEQYAIQTGIHPAITTEKAIQTFRRQLKSFGFSYDWSREISTADPKYYKWTQFIFEKLFEKGLAYQKEVPVNWCPALRTVLANEEVVDGKSERGGHPVIRQPMKQWMLKITDYAERLLNDLDKIDWPERTKEGQRNWIGKSEGAHVRFAIEGLNSGEKLEVFTTRPDTLFGVTFMVLAPEHPLVAEISTPDQQTKVNEYVRASAGKLEVDRKAATEKTGVATGGFAINPLNGERIPIWIADYVLMDYGTGAIMAVPGHDERDFEFAKAFGLPIKRVLAADGEDASTPLEAAFTGEGTLVNSRWLDGLKKSAAIPRAIDELEKKDIGRRETTYRLRDWLFSRQRYWGEPFPIVHYPKAGTQIVPPAELPVALPEVADYQPSDKGEAPLARNQEWVQYKGANGETGRRETDTMPGSAGSSWYFLRFADPHNDQAPISKEADAYWLPVDLYVGGPEHTVGHLLYARFWTKVLFDAGLVSRDEPFQKLAHQGMILGADGEKMSKSRGNVVNLDEIVKEYGADVLRAYICFLGPLDKDKPWSPTGIDGIRRFLDRISRLVVNEEGAINADDKPLAEDVNRLLHKTIKKVTDDIAGMSFNTAISAMMIFVNELYRTETKSRAALRPLVQLLMPFAPHLAEELWEKLGGEGFVSLAPWPEADKSLLADEQITLGVQVNGKMRGTIQLPPNAAEDVAVAAAKADNAIGAHLSGKNIEKVIYKAGRILNLIVK